MTTWTEIKEPEKVSAAHAWQAHRIRCLKLAIRAGATMEGLTDQAEMISTYILTASEAEMQSRTKDEK